MSSNGFVGFTNTDIVSRQPSSEHFEGNQNDGFNVVRFADGSFGIEKSMKDWVGNKTGRNYPAELLAAQEYLAARVGQAIDAPVRDCLFTSKNADSVIMPFVVGQSGKDLGGKDVPNDPQGIQLQIFDHICANSDRRPKNLMFTSNGIVGIDHALCNFRLRPPKPELLANLYNEGVTPDDIRALVPLLETTKPYFAQLQMMDKYENMLANLASLAADLQIVEQSVVKKGDVSGHEFHGNQFVKLGSTEIKDSTKYAFEGGAQAKAMEKVTLGNGEKGIVKVFQNDGWGGPSAKRQAWNEALAAKVGKALDIPIRDAVRIDGRPDAILQPHLEGQSWLDLGSETPTDSPKDVPEKFRQQMGELALFDTLISNPDRHGGNVMVTGIDPKEPLLRSEAAKISTARLVGIDHSSAFNDENWAQPRQLAAVAKEWKISPDRLSEMGNALHDFQNDPTLSSGEKEYADAMVATFDKAFPQTVKKDAFTPPQGVQDAAKKALEWMADGKAGSGFTSVGRKRASDLARGASVSEVTIRRMKAYFDRHQPDKKSPHWDEPSPGKVAWYAWGGDAGYSWAKSVVERLNKVQKGDVEGHAFHGNQWTGGSAEGALLTSDQVKSAIMSQQGIDEFNRIMSKQGYLTYPQNHPLFGGCGVVMKALQNIYPNGKPVAIGDPIKPEEGQDDPPIFVQHYALQIGDDKFVDGNGEQTLQELKDNFLKSSFSIVKYWDVVPATPELVGLFEGIATCTDAEAKDYANALLEASGSSQVVKSASKAAGEIMVAQYVQKGDVQGHEFHGNQWTETGNSVGYGNKTYHHADLTTSDGTVLHATAMPHVDGGTFAEVSGEKNGYTIRHTQTDVGGGQSYYQVTAHDANGNVVGHLDYAVADGEKTPHIQMVETSPSARGNGLATSMYHVMAANNPGATPEQGMLTDDGSKWWNSPQMAQARSESSSFTEYKPNVSKSVITKGDDPGHPFHGNQWTTGEAGVKDLSQHIDTVDMSDIEAWRNRRNGGGTTTTRTPSAPKPAPAPRAPRPATAPKPQTAPKAPQTPSTGEKGLPAGWHTVSKADGRITLKSDAGNSAVFSTRGSWKTTDPEAHTMLSALDKYATGKTINFAPKEITKGIGDALGYVSSKNPNTIEIMPKSRVDGELERTTSNFKTGGNPAMEQALRDAHDKSISASSFANQHGTFTCFASKDKALEAIVVHELGHSDFFSRGLSMDSVYKALGGLGGHLNEQRIADAERQGYRKLMGRSAGFRMPDGSTQNRAGALDWLMKNGAGSADLRGTAVASWIAERGMSKYGTTSLADTVAEAYCAYRMPELPKTDAVNALAGALGWTQKAVSSENAPTDWSGGVGFTDGFDGPTMILGDKAYDYATGEWSEAFEPNPELADDTPKGEITKATKWWSLWKKEKEAEKSGDADEASQIHYQLLNAVYDDQEVKKGDVPGHEFHGNQYEQGNGMDAIEAWRNRRAGENITTTPKPPRESKAPKIVEPPKSSFVGLKSTEVAETLTRREKWGGALNKGFDTVRLKDGSIGVVKHNETAENADAEVLQARIGKAIGTPIRDAAFVAGSNKDTIHPYIEGHTTITSPYAERMSVMMSEGMGQIRWLDTVTGNYDRNRGNIMVQKDGSVLGIDGGNAFHGTPSPEDLFKVIRTSNIDQATVSRTNDAINGLLKMKDLTDNQKNIVLNEVLPSWNDFWNNGGSEYVKSGTIPPQPR